MYDINESKEIINKAFIAINIGREPSGLYEPIAYALSVGGKRLRPALAIMACNLFTDKVENAINPALGIEIFHNFTLLHDDIMDNAPIRRGNPTVHAKWNNNTAILSGDAMMIKANQFIAKTPVEFLPAVLDVFNQVALQVCEGQQYDMNFEKQQIVFEEDYLEMIRLKTAVLIGGAIKIGAIIGNASKADADHLYHFGENLGLAFQLQDDLLDSFGDSKVFGKAIGGDIIANKKTFLLINTLNTLSGDDLVELKKWTKAEEFDNNEKIEAVKNLFSKANVEHLTKERISKYLSKALEHLEKVSVKDDKKEILKELCQSLTNRSK